MDACSGGVVRRVLGVWLIGLLGGCLDGEALPERRLPSSTSVQEVPDAEAHIVVTRRSISLDGVPVLDLGEVDGLPGVPADQRRGVLITELHRQLLDRARAAQGRAVLSADAAPFRGTVAVEMDRDLPGTLLVQVAATAVGADFDRPWIVVDGGGSRRGIPVRLPTAETEAATTSAPATGGTPTVTAGYANPQLTLDAERGFVLEARDKVLDPTGAGLVLPCDPSPCVTGWPTVELNRLARRLKLDHPRDRAVVVTPTGSADVQAVVGALDATRHDATAGRGNRELFPEVILGLESE